MNSASRLFLVIHDVGLCAAIHVSDYTIVQQVDTHMKDYSDNSV